MAENRQHDKTCRECQCPDCVPTSAGAMAERNDAWLTANRNLTDAAKTWPKYTSENGEQGPQISPLDVFFLAYWLHTGETLGGAIG